MEISAVITETEFASLNERINWAPFDGARILITGATGMVGSWLTTALLLAKECNSGLRLEIDALVHSGNITNLRTFRENTSLNFIKISDLFSQKKLSYDLVIHAASPASPQLFRDQESLSDINVGFIQEITERSTTLPELIYFSTGEVYGTGHLEKIRELAPQNIDVKLARSMYPLAKIEAENYISRAYEGSVTQFNIFRLFHTFGPGMRLGDGRSFADFIWDGALMKRPKLYSAGSQVRSFLYLEDMVAAVLGTPRENSIMNLGSEIPSSIREFAELVSIKSGLGGELEFSGMETNFALSPNDFLVPDVTKLSLKGWSQNVSLSEGIERSVKWARR